MLFSRVAAQDSLPAEVERLLELLGEQQGDEETDYSQLTLKLQSYLREPLHLNKATDEELEELQVLNTLQIQLLRQHLQKHGDLLSVYELQSIDGFTEPVIRALFPFVTVHENVRAPKFGLKAALYDGKHEITLRASRILEEQKGFSATDSASLAGSMNSRYAGDPYKLYARYRFTFGNRISAGFTAEKDPGEVFLKNKLRPGHSFYQDSLTPYLRNGFDMYSAHYFMRSGTWLRALALGDFQAGFGQGLICWSGIAYGKNPDGISIRRSAGGLKPHTGTDENLFLRGAGITLGKGKWELTNFFSRKKIDANLSLDTTLTEGEYTFTSFQTSGLHSTFSELKDRKVLEQTLWGNNFRFTHKKIRLGATALFTRYDLPLQKETSLYNQYTFQGSEALHASVDYSIILHNMNFFGEVAARDAGGLALVNGWMVAADPALSFSLLYRYYSRNYEAPLANAVAENSRAANEQGLYLGFNARLSRTLSLSGFYDQFHFPWLKYQVSAPSSGYETTAQLHYQPARRTELYLRFRHREKPADEDLDGLDVPMNVIQDNFRFNLTHQIHPAWRIKMRMEYISLRKPEIREKESGMVLAQDVQWKPIGSRWAVSLRYALFETDSYDSRVYIYENDLPGSYSIPALYDSGSRTYLMFSCDLNRHFEICGRLAQTWYNHKDIISEGSLTEISGNTKTEGKAMLRVKW